MLSVRQKEDYHKGSGMITNNSFPAGLTVRELKEIVNDLPDIDDITGEENEVWLAPSPGLSRPITGVYQLGRGDVLFE